MDNIENTGPEEAADVTAAQGQPDVPDTQPSENSEVADNGSEPEKSGEEASATPWANDPKFKGKTSDDIYKAYQEAEKAIGQVSQKAEIANLIEEKYGLTPEQFKAQVERIERAEKQQLYANNPLAPIVDEVETLKQKLTEQEQKSALLNEERTLDKFLSGNPEYSPFRDKILKLALNLEQDRPYEDIAKEYFGESIAQGQRDAYKKIDTKRMTQATGASQSSPKGGLTLEDTDNMTAADMEKILPWADVSHRL